MDNHTIRVYLICLASCVIMATVAGDDVSQCTPEDRDEEQCSASDQTVDESQPQPKAKPSNSKDEAKVPSAEDFVKIHTGEKPEDDSDKAWLRRDEELIQEIRRKEAEEQEKRKKRKEEEGRESKMRKLQKELDEVEKIERERKAKEGSVTGDEPERLCPRHLFQCGSQECILPTSKCDGENDCLDASDEEGCPPLSSEKWKCPHNLFTCKNKECVLQHYRCDGTKHCSDGSDEWNCDDKTLKGGPIPRQRSKWGGSSKKKEEL